MSLSSLSTQQFGNRTANDNDTSANGQGSPSTTADNTTTTVTVKGSAPAISTRST